MLARSLWEQEKTTIHHSKLQDYVQTELKTLIDSPQKLIELDGEIRTASFLIRDDPGEYGFAHSSYAEYFLARELSSKISAGNIGTLATRRLTNEVIDFLLWMVDKESFEKQLTEILLLPYQTLLSENALALLYRLRRNLLIDEISRGQDAAKLSVEMPTRVQLQGARLAEINLEGAILQLANLDGADLRQCTARGADFSNSSFRSASIRKGDLQGACLRGVDATNAVMVELNCHSADVRGANFTDADLSNSVFSVKKLSGATFLRSLFNSAVLAPNAVNTILERGGILPVNVVVKDKEREFGTRIINRKRIRGATRSRIRCQRHRL